MSATSSAGRGGAGSGGRRCLWAQVLQPTGRRSERARGHLRVQRRCLEPLVPEQHLDDADVLLLMLEAVCREAAAAYLRALEQDVENAPGGPP
jgi:hypothetical protein